MWFEANDIEDCLVLEMFKVHVFDRRRGVWDLLAFNMIKVHGLIDRRHFERGLDFLRLGSDLQWGMACDKSADDSDANNGGSHGITG